MSTIIQVMANALQKLPPGVVWYSFGFQPGYLAKFFNYIRFNIEPMSITHPLREPTMQLF